jgi:hypothetical protein
MTTAGEHPFNTSFGNRLSNGFSAQSHHQVLQQTVADPNGDPGDAMETYFSCITTCSLDDGGCITQCVEEFRQHH